MFFASGKSRRLLSEYKQAHSFEKRKAETDKARERNPDRIPIICERVAGSKIAEIDRIKFLVPGDLILAQFILVVRDRIQLDKTENIIMFVGDSLPSVLVTLNDLYKQYADDDGFLYVKYSGENPFG